MVSGHMRGMDEFEIEHLNRLERIRSLLDITPDTHITLVGDVMLDRFVTGEAETLATTAPAPALRVIHTINHLVLQPILLNP